MFYVQDRVNFNYWVWHETNCIESFTLNIFFKYVYVGWELKERIEIAKRKMGIK